MLTNRRQNPPHFYEKTGKNWLAYYHAVKIAGKLRWTPLGTDRDTALRKWAEIEGCEAPLELKSVAAVSRQYMQWAREEVRCGRLSKRTYDDRDAYQRYILPVLGQRLLESVKPEHIRLYLDNRSAKIVGKKEMRFFSVVWNWARERGITALANPVAGVKMPTETGRSILVRDVDYWRVHDSGDQLVRDVLLLAARVGTRPQEVFDLKWQDITFSDPGVTVNVWQNKIKQWRTVMGGAELADQLRALRDTVDGDAKYVLCKKDGKPVKMAGTFRVSFCKARAAAVDEAAERGETFQSFQLRDIRPMAGINMMAEQGMDAARQLLGHATEKMTAHYTTKRVGMVSKSGTMKRLSKGKLDKNADEKALGEVLAKEVSSWQTAESIRAYVAHIKSVSGNHVVTPDAKLSQWTAWAGAVADQLDPTRQRLASAAD